MRAIIIYTTDTVITVISLISPRYHLLHTNHMPGTIAVLSLWHDFSTSTSLWSYEAILWWENWGWKGAKEHAQHHPARRVMETGSALSSQGPAFNLCVPRSRDVWDQTDQLSWSKGSADLFQASYILTFIAFSFHYVAHICYFYDHTLPILSHILFHMLTYLRSGTFHSLSRSGSRCDRAVIPCLRCALKQSECC